MAQKTSMVFLQYLTTVFDNVKDAILLVGIEPKDTFRVLIANDGFTRSTGHTLEAIGKTVEETVHPDTYKKLLPRYHHVIKTKHASEFTETYESPLGQQVFDVKIIPILGAVGDVVQLAIISHNVTELHQLRNQVKEAAESLEQVTYNLRHGQQL
jgi:PAS domain S-box-containing protein